MSAQLFILWVLMVYAFLTQPKPEATFVFSFFFSCARGSNLQEQLQPDNSGNG